MVYTKSNSKSAIHVKLLVVLSGILLFFFTYQNYKNERDDLSFRLTQTVKEKDRFKFQLNEMRKTVIPLENEINVLKNSMLVSGQKTQDDTKTLIPEHNEGTDETEKSITRNIKKKSARVLADTKDKISATKKNLERLKDYIKSVEEQNAVLKEKANQVRILLETKNKEFLELNRTNVILKTDLEKAVQGQEKLKEELNAASMNIRNIKIQLSNKEAEALSVAAAKGDFEKRLNELNEKLTVLGDTNASLQKQVFQYQQEKISLQTDLNNVKEKLDTQTTLNDTLHKKVIEVTQVLDDKEKARNDLITELEQLKESKRHLEDEFSEFKTSKSGNENQVSQLNSRLSELNVSYESVRNTVAQLSTLLTKREMELSEKQKELWELKDSFDKTNRERETLLSSAENKEKSIADLKETLHRMESQVVSLQSELTLTKEHQRKTLRQLSEISSINTSLQERLSDISRELEPLRQETSLDKKVADTLRKKVEVKLELDKEQVDKGIDKGQDEEDTQE